MQRIRRNRQSDKILLCKKAVKVCKLKVTLGIAKQEIAEHHLALAEQRRDEIQAEVDAAREYLGVLRSFDRSDTSDYEPWDSDLEASGPEDVSDVELEADIADIMEF